MIELAVVKRKEIIKRKLTVVKDGGENIKLCVHKVIINQII
jgi:hypothetical protein